MEAHSSRSNRYAQVETTLALFLVLLKAQVVHATWGKVQGYDWGPWMEMFHATYWFEPIPPVRIWGASYHPPLSYLIGRLICLIYPHEIEVSQINSTLAVVVAFFCVRQVLKRIGWLWTLPGLWLLYGGISVPVIVSVGVETTYDSWVLAWYMMALAASVGLFWNATSPTWWKNNRTARKVTWLGLVFAAGLLNKYTGLLAFALPFIVILVRRGFLAVVRESTAPITAIAISVLVVFPLYYERNYKTEGRWMPAAMDWQRRDDLRVAIEKRDAAPVAFVVNMLKYPLKTPKDPQAPVLDSFTHITWLHTWTKDWVLAAEPEPALTVSRKYSQWFAATLLAGTVWFVARFRRIDKEWRDVGWVLLLVTAIYCGLALSFGWKYPLWDWRVFKTKYMTPAVFFIPYATAIVFADKSVIARLHGRLRFVEDLAFYALILFVALNHLLPVY